MYLPIFLLPYLEVMMACLEEGFVIYIFYYFLFSFLRNFDFK